MIQSERNFYKPRNESDLVGLKSLLASDSIGSRWRNWGSFRDHVRRLWEIPQKSSEGRKKICALSPLEKTAKRGKGDPLPSYAQVATSQPSVFPGFFSWPFPNCSRRCVVLPNNGFHVLKIVNEKDSFRVSGNWCHHLPANGMLFAIFGAGSFYLAYCSDCCFVSGV